MFKPDEIKILEKAKWILQKQQSHWDGKMDVKLLHETKEGLAQLIDPTYTPLF